MEELSRDITTLVIAIVIFSSFSYIVIPNAILDFIWAVMINLFVFATQNLGVGAVYSIIKEKKENMVNEEA